MYQYMYTIVGLYALVIPFISPIVSAHFIRCVWSWIYQTTFTTTPTHICLNSGEKYHCAAVNVRVKFCV